jgi:phosphoglycolate phosphatase
MIKLIIFDWDDVITLHSTEGYIKCYHLALEAVGVHLTPAEELERIKENWGKTHIQELQGLLKEHPELVKKAAEVYHQKLFGNTFIDTLELAPGVNEFLVRLSKNYKLAVATGMNYEILTQKVMPKFGIPQVFSEIISGYQIEDETKQKPSPYMAQELMQRCDAKPAETVVVGDAYNDMKMAQGAGVIPIVVLTGYLDKKEAIEIGIKYIIQAVTDLESVLKVLNTK